MGKIKFDEIEKLANALSLSAAQIEKIIVNSQSKMNLINYLAEIAETSPTNVKEAINNAELGSIPLEESIEKISQSLPKASMNEVWNTMKNTITPSLFITFLSTECNKEEDIIEKILEKSPFKKLVLKKRLEADSEITYVPYLNRPEKKFSPNSDALKFAQGKIQFIGFGGPERKIPLEKLNVVNHWIELIYQELKDNPPAIFQDGILEYYKMFTEGPMPENEAKLLSEEIKIKYGTYSSQIIDRFIIERFGNAEEKKCPTEKANYLANKIKQKIKYVITFGIGGNEMRWHVLSDLHNSNPKSKIKWIPLNFASDIGIIPDDAKAENTIQIAYSRSGDTEETKASLEVLGSRFPNTIVYANKGDLKTLGEKLGALVLPFPPKIAGRYCGLKTPVNLAPMYILGMDIKRYWSVSDKASKMFVPKSKTNPAWEIAKFIFKEKMLTGSKMIYLGNNHPLIKKSLDEVDQYIMEGLAKEGNELFSMVGMQYPRNSHYEIEGPLGNPDFWIYWNVICTNVRTGKEYDTLLYKNSIIPEKRSLYADEVLMTLIAGNLNTFAGRSPSVLILISDLDLETFAVLSKIYEDTIYYVCRLCMVDPFGNPAVKNVRLESAKNVEMLYKLKKKKINGKDLLFNLIKEKYS